MGAATTLRASLDSSQQLWECIICFTEQSNPGWACVRGHRFCADCMRRHAESTPFPRCPHEGCDYMLGEADFEQLQVPLERLEAFRRAAFSVAMDTLACGGESLVRCSDAQCPNAVVLPAGEGRRRFACHCGAPPFCTQCRQTPYHYFAECSQVQGQREQWLAWVSGGRDAYNGKKLAAVENEKRNLANEALRDAIARHEELEADELWKSRHCRLCPSCSRPIQRVAGCSSMVCGRNYHGGAQQPGCGQSFEWKDAKRYIANVERRELPEMATEEVRLRGRSAFHPFIECKVCHGVGIAGPRFRCIHCESFDACSKCEHRLVEEHEPGHVFEIMFESDFQWSGLPRGTRVRLVRSAGCLPRARERVEELPRAADTPERELEGLFGSVRKNLCPVFEGYRVKLDSGAGTLEVANRFLEPVLSSRQQAEDLLAKSLEAAESDESDSHASVDVDEDEYEYFEEEEEEESSLEESEEDNE